MFKAIVGFAVSGLGYMCNSAQTANAQEDKADSTRCAITVLNAETDQMTHGLVAFKQENITAPTEVIAHIKNLNADKSFGLFVTNYGDYIQAEQSLGGVYNPRALEPPFERPHETNRVGDIGIVKADHRGIGYMAIRNKNVKLFGDESILGRGIALHQGERDDTPLLASGVVGLSKDFKTIAPQ